MKRGAGAGRVGATLSITARRVAVLGLALVAAPVLLHPSAASASGRTPIVFFPGYGATRLRVVVDNQFSAPG
jgi:hypothetical protein